MWRYDLLRYKSDTSIITRPKYMQEIIVGRMKKLRLNSKSLFLFNKNSKQQKFSFREYFLLTAISAQLSYTLHRPTFPQHCTVPMPWSCIMIPYPL